jgi:hypothetical protein
MEQIAIVARLRPGAEPEARKLVEGGPPFDPAEAGLRRHAVYVAAEEVVFVFEAPDVEWIVDDMVDAPFQWRLTQAFEAWRSLIDGQPRIARAAYAWTRETDSTEIASS